MIDEAKKGGTIVEKKAAPRLRCPVCATIGAVCTVLYSLLSCCLSAVRCWGGCSCCCTLADIRSSYFSIELRVTDAFQCACMTHFDSLTLSAPLQLWKSGRIYSQLCARPRVPIASPAQTRAIVHCRPRNLVRHMAALPLERSEWISKWMRPHPCADETTCE